MRIQLPLLAICASPDAMKHAFRQRYFAAQLPKIAGALFWLDELLLAICFSQSTLEQD